MAYTDQIFGGDKPLHIIGNEHCDDDVISLVWSVGQHEIRFPLSFIHQFSLITFVDIPLIIFVD